jgi:hypothetical protein
MQSALSETLVQRVIGAARLDGAVYEEVEHDINASSQALMVVGVAAVSAAIGGLNDGFSGLISALISGLVGFAIASYFVYFVGTRLTPSTQTSANYGEVMRCLGFAYAPNLLLFLHIIPGIGGLLSFLIGIWAIVTMVVATMHALEMSAVRAVVTSILASIIAAIVIGIIVAIIGGTAIGIGALT